MSMFNWRWLAGPRAAIALVFGFIAAQTVSMSSVAAGPEQGWPDARRAIVSGIFRVVEGDTLDVGGRRVRLAGIRGGLAGNQDALTILFTTLHA